MPVFNQYQQPYLVFFNLQSAKMLQNRHAEHSFAAGTPQGITREKIFLNAANCSCFAVKGCYYNGK